MTGTVNITMILRLRAEYLKANGYGNSRPLPGRAVAIVALRRIVDRAVSDELDSPATTDILRIALKALNTLEE